MNDDDDDDNSPTSHTPPPSPGPPHPPPNRTGTIPFRIPSTGEIAGTAYSLWGDPSAGVPLICIHGGPGIAHNYLLPISRIHTTHGVPVIMYDQIGCGRSTRFRGRREVSPGGEAFWTVELFVAELENLVRGLGITGEYDVLGHSWGGVVGVVHAARGTARMRGRGVRRLVLCSVPGDVERWRGVEGRLRRALPTHLSQPLLTLPPSSPAYQTASVAFYRLHLCRTPVFPPELLASLAALAVDSTVYDALLHHGGPLATWSAAPYLVELNESSVPGGMLLVNGAFDEAGADEGTMMPYFVGTGVRRVRWVVFGRSAQMAWLEEGERFVGVLGGFLREGEEEVGGERRNGEGG